MFWRKRGKGKLVDHASNMHGAVQDAGVSLTFFSRSLEGHSWFFFRKIAEERSLFLVLQLYIPFHPILSPHHAIRKGGDSWAQDCHLVVCTPLKQFHDCQVRDLSPITAGQGQEKGRLVWPMVRAYTREEDPTHDWENGSVTGTWPWGWEYTDWERINRWITDKWSGPVWGGIGRTRQDVRWMIFLQVRKSSRRCERGLLILWVIPERSSAFWRRLQLGLHSALWVDEGSSHHLWWKEYEMYPKRVYMAIDG